MQSLLYFCRFGVLISNLECNYHLFVENLIFNFCGYFFKLLFTCLQEKMLGMVIGRESFQIVRMKTRSKLIIFALTLRFTG